MKIVWKGTGLNEKGYWKNKPIIEIDKRYFRPTEVNSLRGDANIAKKELNWKPKYTVVGLIKDMVYQEFKS